MRGPGPAGCLALVLAAPAAATLVLAVAQAAAPVSALSSVALAAPAASSARPLWTDASRKPPARVPAPAEVAERAAAAVVHVRGTKLGASPDGGESGAVLRLSIGTGFLIAADGSVVTNEHVVRDAVDLRVRLRDGRELPACVVGADRLTDIALLRAETTTPLPVLPLGDSDAVRAGEAVLAIGNPFGFDHSVTAGIVSAGERVVDRDTGRGGETPENYVLFIQTDAAINVGNSGGPLIDRFGAVIGINAAFWAGQPMQPASGISFAIPVNIAKSLLPRLRDRGEAPRSFLGVDAQPIDPSLARALGLSSTQGALIASVQAASAAEEAGLEVGDVVVSWARHPVHTGEDLKIRSQLTPPDSRVAVALLRGGKTIERTLTTRTAPRGAAAAPHPWACGRPRAAAAVPDGLEVVAARAELCKGLPGGRGVAVQRAAPNSPAAEAGLRPDDVILRAGAGMPRTPTELGDTLRAAPRGTAIPLLVRRSGYDFWTALVKR